MDRLRVVQKKAHKAAEWTEVILSQIRTSEVGSCDADWTRLGRISEHGG